MDSHITNWRNVTPEQIAADKAKAAIWPTEAEKTQNFKWTEKYPRPIASTWPYNLPTVEQSQQQWDESNAALQDHLVAVAQLRADREAREEAQRAQWQQQQDAHAAQQRAETMAMLKRNFLATAGTTEADFERVKDDLFLDYAKRQALSGDMERAQHAQIHATLKRAS